MEALTRLVTESLARHGLDRPVDPRRLQWSAWFRCDTPHSLLVVPSKPGIFALAEEVVDLGPRDAHVGTAAPGSPAERSSAVVSRSPNVAGSGDQEGRDFSRAAVPAKNSPALAPAGIVDGNHRSEIVRRMLAVLQFSEDDDMAFVLDRMFTRPNPLRTRLSSGHCFLRFVVIQDQAQRRSICSALNQWLISSAERASGLGADFTSSLEAIEKVGGNVGTSVGRTLLSANANIAKSPSEIPLPKPQPNPVRAAPHLDSGAASNIHCPQPLPSGF